MKSILLSNMSFLLLLLLYRVTSVLITDENLAREWLRTYNVRAAIAYNKYWNAKWNYDANITEFTKNKTILASLEYSNFKKEAARNASAFDWTKFSDYATRREFRFISDIGVDALNDTEKIKQIQSIQADMMSIYSTAKVCNITDNRCVGYSTGLSKIMASSGNYSQLEMGWKLWRDATGRKMKDKYQTFVTLQNEGVRATGRYNDVGESWRALYEVATFEDDVRRIMEELAPLYIELHTYVRDKLQKQYPEHKFPKSGHIPAHLLGNMWSQSWTNIMDIVKPYPLAQKVDLTSQLIAQNYTVKKIFETAEEFFVSLGLPKLPDAFWEKSILEKPKDGRDMVCQASAWTFYNKTDWRVKMCTTITKDNFVTVHHELGHVFYDIMLKDQPIAFQEGANPGFQEAIGNMIALSVATPEHLHKIGLLETVENNKETDINFLMSTALKGVAFLPFGYLVDQWRWSVFRGNTTKDQYNKHWWDLRCKYQGIYPPVERTEEDFDPGAKFHIPGNYPYIRYFVRIILQFQIHKALCDASGHSGPLYKCDIYQSKAAGDLLRKMFSLGKSRPWPDVLENVTGQRKMDVAPVKEYFQTLIDWLQEQNKNKDKGWIDGCPSPSSGLIEDEDAASRWLDTYNKEARKAYNKQSRAYWKHNTNMTQYNLDLAVESSVEVADFKKKKAKEASAFDWRNFSSSSMRREFTVITDIGVDALQDKEKIKRINAIEVEMEELYSRAKVCNVTGIGCITMETGLADMIASSRNYTQLLHGWKAWRDATGKKMKDKYETYVKLVNEGIRATGAYKDAGERRRSWYEVPTFEEDIKNLLDDLSPLYNELHAYVREKLQSFYKEYEFPKSGHIPAHLLGNMWSQVWNNVMDIVKPFPNATSVDVTPQLRAQNYTARQMYEIAEEFFISLGFSKMTKEFWENSMLQQPEDGRKVVCHASAWDFFTGTDFRIKMCTNVNMNDLVTVHHEMGHTVYDMLYAHQPVSFMNSANPGFHEAIGDLMALSVVTPKHLYKIGLLETLEENQEADINFLMKMALEKIAFLPFGYLIDQWRWSVFRGDTTKDQYNRHWWDLRCKYQGIYPAVERTEEDFDPGAKWHIPGDTPYIRYFISYVIQFQFHKALCNVAGHVGPLHKCDIYQSKAAGDLLSKALSLGASRPWPDAMEIITGQRKMDVGPIKEYFQPLIQWLKAQNQGKKRGWSQKCPMSEVEDEDGVGLITDEDKAKQWLEEYELNAQKVMYKDGEAEWAYNTNITDYNSEVSVNVSLETSEFQKKSAAKANTFDWRNFQDKNLTRQFRKITDIGTSALEDLGKLAQLKKVGADMEGIYSKANVCLSDGQCHQIEPGLTRLLAHSDNYTKLSEAWKGWRDATGKKMKEKYQELVELSNEAIKVMGYNDTGEYWRSWYETSTFQSDLQKLLEELAPLYENLHAFVRRKLKEKFGAEHFPASGHIPAHLLGNMWGQQWNNIGDLVQPFPGKKSIDVTPKLIALGWNATKLFKVAEEFFVSLGLKPMPDNFWKNSMIVKPDGREVVCHASAWDFYNRHDYRIKMCTDITMENLITIHHEMGHIQYYLQYKDQPVSYREGTNPGFHEAVGDVMALSVSTPEHLYKIGLLNSVDNDTDSDLNFLMSKALEKIAFLPFGYLIDQWRWSVFSGETPPSKYNDKWWQLRCKYQGLSPPVMRSSDDFDPGAKYHIPANVPYIRYFVSFVIQFQFHKALCDAAGQTGPLHRCDIYNNLVAGQKLSDMLKVGSSIPWQDAMQKITGQRNMSAKPLMEYFKPLVDWLKEQNKGHEKGWNKNACPNIRSMSLNRDISQGKQWLQEYNTLAEHAYYMAAEAEWAYATNITDDTQQKLVLAKLELAKFKKEASRNASSFDWKNFSDKDVRRQFLKISDIGTDALPDLDKLKKLNEVKSEIKSIYAKGKVCLSTKGCVKLEPGLVRLLTTSRNQSELLEAWQGWRIATGRKMKDKYAEFAKLSNEGVQELGYADTGAYWRSWYETPTFQQDLEKLMEELKPFYEQLHAYTRNKLIEVYGEENFPSSGHIPAHLTGNMWAQSWNNIYDLLIPFKNKTSVDVTNEMRKQNYTPIRMFRTAEGFFKSLNLSAMPQPFWDKSMIVKPKDGRDVVCHASAWDFNNRKDFRIKMCTDTNVTMEDLITIHHEMGHVQYYLQYKDQPSPFREGANPGFHEAIGDTLALSAATPKHLHQIGLLDKLENDQEADINFLMKMALQKIAFLPFGYLIDQWRWSVFSGETPVDKYNDKWWKLRCKYQGISPPVKRSEEDFDPGAKNHIPSNTPYIRYFVSYVIQFQFHKALCEAAGHSGPLHRCDIYKSTAAGKKLGDVLKLGSSVPWPDAMEAITGQRNMSAKAILDYFTPLTDWMKKQNAGKRVGWDEKCALPRTLLNSDLTAATDWLKEYNKQAEMEMYKEMEVEWTYATNITDENAQRQVLARLELAKFKKEASRNASSFDWKNFPDKDVKRQFSKISDIGTDALSDLDQLTKLNELQSEIEGIYAKAKVCVNNKGCMKLEPGLVRLLTTSRNQSELLEAWQGWRIATGRKMKDKYAEFAKLSNEGVRELGYADTGAYWRSWYETPTFQQDLQKLLEELKPFYEQLHAYTRNKLIEVYGEEHFPSSGHIPAHLTGNMWAQSWNNIYDILIPFKNKTSVDVTNEMRKQNYTPIRMFRTAEGFFKSLNLSAMPQPFWDKSMIVKPKDGRDVVCHASAWDFYNRKDFRIKMCTDTNVNMEDLITIHHEMGHIQYYLQYKDQPVAYREGANPGFHEAIGDTMALSASTPAHLHSIGLLNSTDTDPESELNFLMSMATDKIAFLPFGYLIDQWRWSVFSGETPKEKYNDKWWELRCKYQGVSPPYPRTSEDFDPGCKYHIPANTPYIRYFVSYVIQFQFHKALCEAAGHSGPLHRCDIYKSTAAGKKLGDVLKLGSSMPWPDAMEAITGQRNMSAKAILDYFKPLTDWMKKQNAGKRVGWDEKCALPRTLLNSDLTAATDWLKEYNKQAEVEMYKESEVEWTYATNVTDENAQRQVLARLELAKFNKEASRNASSFDWQNFPDKDVKRQFSKISDIGTDALSDLDELKKLNELQSDIEGIYAKAKVCLHNKGCLKLEPDLVRLLTTSRNQSELLEAWQGWRIATGRKMKDKYAEFAKLSNEGVRELGYADTGDYWRSWYETPTFQQDLEKLLEELKPFYEQLHAYTRNKLIEVYGEENFPLSGQIPAHLTGNMWAQSWNNIYDILIPFKNKTSVDVTDEMRKQNYTPIKMFRTAEGFFKSLNLSAMPQPFWDKSMIVKPKDGRDVICHASAWDFYNRKDFRIKMCTDITMEDLITIHHEMGHIQYYLQYKDQPVPFREGANPGFHEAIGDTMALSASTPAHLHSIGLLKSTDTDPDSELNFLMSMALDKIAFLPFGYLIDQWRWSVFSGETPKEKYNDKWWELRCKYQGVSPPYPRASEDFDPGSKYHIPANTPYIRYFVSYVIQFQFHKALCEAAGHSGPLHRCDIYQSTAAGKKLGDVLKLGSSVPWPDAMEAITGQRNMSAKAILDYFKPLTDWMKKQNEGKRVGWDEKCALPRKLVNSDLMAAVDWLKEYNKQAEVELYKETEVEWIYSTNITDENSKKQVAARLQLAKFEKAAAKNASMFNYQSYMDESVKRQFRAIKDIGTSALEDEDKLNKLNSLQSELDGIYSKAKVCLSSGNCVPLDPDLYRIMSTSRNYTELEEVWKGWRDVSGKKMKQKYAEFVQISNEGVRELGYADTGAYWRSWYESPTFQQDLVKLLDQLKPLYQELHTYVRRKLVDLYGADHFPVSGHIPAHLLGNMWAQEWQNLYDLLIPYKGKVNVDVTPIMKARNYSADRMFHIAEDFFKSLGLKSMPQAFWDKSMIVKPPGREVDCHPSAWDFYNHKDFRIKMCTDITMENLVTIHHEMGHIQYYLQYKDQPVPFREGANPGFHEAIGDTLALSAATPKHLHQIGLLDKLENDQEADINFLMKMALEKIAFLPFGYLIDQWRWSVFSGETPVDKYNDKWWKLRCKYQGISPPVKRSEDDFDPGAKNHIPSNTPYIRYFVSNLIQFQFHKALCEAAGQTGPLYQCDIYNSTAAGRKLGDMLKLGSSQPWPEAMEALTGQRKMDATAILDYFKPLADWLKVQNKGENQGWNEECSDIMPRDAKKWLESYQLRAEAEYNTYIKAQWNHDTNITDYNKEILGNASLQQAVFRKEAAHNATLLGWRYIQDHTLQRRLRFIADIGTGALTNQDELTKLDSLIAKMTEYYSTGMVNMNGQLLSLEPDLYKILALSTNYDELLQAWKGWRDSTGPRIKPLYTEYVYLSNKATRELGYKDTGDYWRSHYDSPTFKQDIQQLLKELSPLYENLHTYVRKKLKAVYGEDKFPATGHIPAHLLGNMWAQKWDNIYRLVVPFKNKQDTDITPYLIQQNYTVERMFRTAEEFFSSIGMFNMTDAFWRESMLKKPSNRDVVCHAMAWDFYDRKDFRIKMCTVVTQESLIVIHHEMGHVEYFMAYRNQPVEFRDGANKGFHEAVGDVIALSVSTPGHLHKIGLLPKADSDNEAEINFLMKMALEKIAFLPFGYLIDQWRWSVFNGETPPREYNKKWWELRCKYQGVSPPVERTEHDFDPGAKFHIPANYDYIRYFISYVIQFQFHKALCDESGHKGPLNQCDIYQSKAAGKKLRDMLELGSSIPWPDAMEQITGQRKMDVGPLLEYFRPLIKWLQHENINERGGWNSTCPVIKSTPKPHRTNFVNSATGVVFTFEFGLFCMIFTFIIQNLM